MPFDLSTARPVEPEQSQAGGFDLSTAQPVGSLADMIPGNQPQAATPAQTAPSTFERVFGPAEAAATTVTGATGGTLGMIGGALGGLAAAILNGQFGTPEAQRMVEEAAMEGARKLTYQPRTPTGTAIVNEVVAPVMANLGAVAPMTAEMGALESGIRQAAIPARTAAGAVIQRAEEAIPAQRVVIVPTPGTMGSAGAAGTDISAVRQGKAADLPVPIKLTEGQMTRGFEAQQFERETAKLPDIGEPLRQRFAQQNAQLRQNMDVFVDATGAEAPDLRTVGGVVDQALRDRAARDKTRIRTLYKEAEKAGEMEQPVTLDTVVQHLNDSAPEAEVANVLKAVRAKAIKLGIATEQSDGMLVPQPVSLKTGELFRRSINDATNLEPTNIRQASILKDLYDTATEGSGGELYGKARAARARYAEDYENIGLVRQILGLKRGSSDRAIALEDVARRSIIDPSTSLDTVRQLRRLLQTEGENGQQAWRELQGATIRHIRDEALKNVARDTAGNPIISPAQLDRTITALDRTGKLDFVFGKRGAEQLRTINDVAKDVLTVPPGAVNTSNTAATLLAAMDMAISGTMGIPAPILSGVRIISSGLRNAKLKARVKRALGE